MQTAENLLRKQFLIYPGQVETIERLAGRENTSATEMVRRAIDAYDSDIPEGLGENELVELVVARLNEALEDTAHTCERLQTHVVEVDKRTLRLATL